MRISDCLPSVWRRETGQVVPSDLYTATMYRMRQELDAQGPGLSDGWKATLAVGGILAFMLLLFSSKD